MAKSTFDYQGALDAGYSDEEILTHLSEYHPKFDVQGAMESGYSPQEINQHLSTYKPKRSTVDKGARILGQAALGAAENALLPYEIGVAPLANKNAMNALYRENLGSELEDLMDKKASGQWDERDQELYEHITKQILDPRESEKFVQTADVGVRDIAEKITGQDLHPEGILEKAAHWTSFIRNPKNAAELAILGTSPKMIKNAIIPGAKDIMRGLSAGAALQLAENNNFGPMGTMASAIIGDLMGAGVAGIGKAITRPKQTAAKLAASLSNTKKSIRNDLKVASQGKEFTKDLGTLTNNNMVQMIQARLSASGLTGKPLQELRKKITNEIVGEYESIGKELAEARFQTMHEAGDAAKQAISKIRDSEMSIAREFYNVANKSLKQGAEVESARLGNAIKEIQKELRPGAIKSTEQNSVLSILDRLNQSLYDEAGNLKKVGVKDLMNNKIALNDIINYEVQGGTKQLLKKINAEIDRAIISHGKENPSFAKNYVNANKRFSDHAKTFRNKNIDQILFEQNPERIMNKMNNVQGIRDVKKVLDKSEVGKQLFKDLSRKKLDSMIGDHMKDGVTEQLKHGKFVNIIKDKNNQAILKEILSPETYKRLIRLQAHVGELSEAAQKFFNSSQSATASTDMAITGQILGGIVSTITGNPWPLFITGSLAAGANQVSRFIADPSFLKMVEEAIVASKKNNLSMMQKISSKISSHVSESGGRSLAESQKNETNREG